MAQSVGEHAIARAGLRGTSFSAFKGFITNNWHD